MDGVKFGKPDFAILVHLVKMAAVGPLVAFRDIQYSAN